jgi:hypothetical protein
MVLRRLCACSEQHAERTASRQRSQWVELIRSYAAHHGLARVSLHSYTAASDAAAAAAAAASAGAPAAAAAASAVAASSASAADRDAALVNKLFRNDAIQRQSQYPPALLSHSQIPAQSTHSA